MDNGRVREAMPHLQAAVALAPSALIPKLALGRCEQAQGNQAQAIEQYKKVIDLTQSDIPNNLWFRYKAFKSMAVAYRDLGDTAHAYESADEASVLVRKYGHK
jgi:tetratricopeptide (TPR) repeat protein